MIADPGTALSLGCLDESRQVTLPYRGWRSDESKAFSGVVTVERREEFREWLGHRIVENGDEELDGTGWDLGWGHCSCDSVRDRM